MSTPVTPTDFTIPPSFVQNTDALIKLIETKIEKVSLPEQHPSRAVLRALLSINDVDQRYFGTMRAQLSTIRNYQPQKDVPEFVNHAIRHYVNKHREVLEMYEPKPAVANDIKPVSSNGHASAHTQGGHARIVRGDDKAAEPSVPNL